MRENKMGLMENWWSFQFKVGHNMSSYFKDLGGHKMRFYFKEVGCHNRSPYFMELGGHKMKSYFQEAGVPTSRRLEVTSWTNFDVWDRAHGVRDDALTELPPMAQWFGGSGPRMARALTSQPGTWKPGNGSNNSTHTLMLVKLELVCITSSRSWHERSWGRSNIWPLAARAAVSRQDLV